MDGKSKGKTDTQGQLWSEEMGKDKEDTFTSERILKDFKQKMRVAVSFFFFFLISWDFFNWVSPLQLDHKVSRFTKVTYNFVSLCPKETDEKRIKNTRTKYSPQHDKKKNSQKKEPQCPLCKLHFLRDPKGGVPHFVLVSLSFPTGCFPWAASHKPVAQIRLWTQPLKLNLSRPALSPCFRFTYLADCSMLPLDVSWVRAIHVPYGTSHPLLKAARHPAAPHTCTCLQLSEVWLVPVVPLLLLLLQPVCPLLSPLSPPHFMPP